MSSRCEATRAGPADVLRLVPDGGHAKLLAIQATGQAWLYGCPVAPIAIGGIFAGEIWLHLLRDCDAATGAALVRVLRRQVADELARRARIVSRAHLGDARAMSLHRVLGFRPTGVEAGHVTYERVSDG